MKYRSYYICHHCTNYITINKTDIHRHLYSSRLCKSNNKYTLENAIYLSLNNKFYFDINEKIDKSNLIYYIENYDKNNKIEEHLNFIKNLDLSYNEENNKYICNLCKSEFVSKQLLKNHLYENKCEKVNKINNEIEENKIINNKKSLKNIEQKCINHNISLNKLEEILDDFISQNKS